MFSREQLERYARHIVLPGVGAAGQRKLLDARVLVVGAGGLGSPLLLYLAAAGVGTLGVADFDEVALSNLQRQVLHRSRDLGRAKVDSAREALADLNPEVRVVAHRERLEAHNVRRAVAGYDLVVDGSDNFATRYLVNDACVLEGRPLLFGAISQFEGQLTLLAAPPGETPCYRCLFPAPPAPGSVPNCAEAGVFGALPGVVGSLMAVEAVKFLLGLGRSLAGTLLHYDALEATSHRFGLQRQPHCPLCGDRPTIRDVVAAEVACDG